MWRGYVTLYGGEHTHIHQLTYTYILKTVFWMGTNHFNADIHIWFSLVDKPILVIFLRYSGRGL